VLNLEGAACLLIILLLAIRTVSNGAGTWKPSRSLDASDAVILLAICAGIAALFWRAAHIGFLSDDFVLLAHARDYRWRSIFSTAGGDGFYRPLIYAIFSLTRRWAGVDPWAWHASGIAIHALNAILVYLIAWALGYSRFVSGFAAALFAVHAAHPEVALWITGRFDLFATLFLLLALLFWIRAWAVAMTDVRPARARLYRTIALLAMIAGLLSKESAYAFPVMVLALIGFNPEWRRRPAAYLPFFIVAAIVFAWRWHLLQGIGGYLTAAGTPEILSQSLFGIFKGFALRLWAILFFPVDWSIRPGLIFGAITLIYAAAVIGMSSIRVKRAALFLPLALLLASVAPVLHLLRIGPDLEKARYLYLPSAMFAVTIAVVIDASKHKWILAAAILAFQSAALLHNFGAWEHSSSKAGSTCEAVADAARAPGAKIAVMGVPQTLEGAYFFANGLPECAGLLNGRRADVTMILDASSAVDRSRFTEILQWNPATEDLSPRP
jgi:hypothetical protein